MQPPPPSRHPARWLRRTLGRKVGVFPSDKNAFHALMLGGFGAEEQFASVTSIAEIEEAWAQGRIQSVYVSWEERFFDGIPLEAQQAAADDIVDRLDRLMRKGLKLAITVHNAAPHEEFDLAAFGRIRQFLLDNAQLVHVFSEAGEKLVEGLGLSPDRCVRIEHPSYVGFFPDPGIAPAAHARPTFLTLGPIRPYKGHDVIIRVFSRLGVPERVGGLTIAGRLPEGESFDTHDLGDRIPLTVNLRPVPHGKIPDLMLSHDYAVQWYRDSLTSGQAMLAMTFGLPVIAPKLGAIPEMLPGALGKFLYEPGDEGSFLEAIERALDTGPDERSALAEQSKRRAASLAPAIQCPRFRAAFRERRLL